MSNLPKFLNSRICSIILLIIGLAGGGQAQMPFPPEKEEKIERLLSEHHVPSISIAQIRGSEIVTYAYGQQDSNVAATPNSLYNIASLTKPVSAEVALRLVSQGIISLDEPMYKYWTDPDIARDDRTKLLTPRLSLSHQTGFAANWRSEDGGTLRFKTNPGTGFGYSGEGYEYLSRFIEKKTGRNLEEHARDLIFKPAGMLSTAFTPQPWFIGKVALPADSGGHWLEPMFASKPVASDRVYTTAGDYVRFMLQVMKDEGLRDSVAHERRRVQVSLREKMCQSLPPEICPDELGMGLGWMVIRYKNETILMHTRHDPGVYTFAYICPENGSGAVILTNGENGKRIVVPVLRELGAKQEFVDFLERTTR